MRNDIKEFEANRKRYEAGQFEPNTWKMSSDMEFKLRFEYAVTKSWMSWLFVTVSVFISCLMFYMGLENPADWIVLVLANTVFLMIAGGVGLWFYRNAKPSYDTLQGIKVIFSSPEYWIPKSVMEKFLSEVMDAWRPYLDVTPERFYRDRKVQLIIQAERPRFRLNPDFEVKPEDIVGITKHHERTSYIYAPYALSHGGAGYEIRLHASVYKWPSMGEIDRKNKMLELGIIK